MALKLVPDTAPFTAEQREWLNQFFLSHLDGAPQGGELSTATVEKPKVTVIWGSQTGNAESCCKKLAKAVSASIDLTVLDMAKVALADLVAMKNVLVVTSTYGDGEAPDNAAELHAALMSSDAPSLKGVSFAVFGLGDTEYPDFCQTAKDFDKRFAELGAERKIDLFEADVDFEDLFESWTQKVVSVFGVAEAVSEEKVESVEAIPFGKKNPYPTTILNNYNLNASESQRETHHIELSLGDSGFEYEVGDALGVYPQNPEKDVDEIIANLGFKPSTLVPTPDKTEVPLRDALIHNYDIRSLSKKLILAWQSRSGSPFLRSLVEADDKAAFSDFIWGRELIDLVLDYPAEFADAEEFVGVLKKLQPRLYSISSSMKAHPNEVHLTIGIVRYNSFGRQRGGVCSTLFSDRAQGLNPKVFVHHNKAFRLPLDNSKPIIMCGPGTGIAPFRAFLEEREITGASGQTWLFFGNPHKEVDFLYEEELKAKHEKGVLSKLTTAFSRDQKEKIYVQDRMMENGAELWKWFQDGALFYICGDASRMAKDVDKALHLIAQEHGGMSESEAVDYFKQLKKDKRYLRDVY